MKMSQALEIIEGDDSSGFVVWFERCCGGQWGWFDYFPSIQEGEASIGSLTEANFYMEKFREAMGDSVRDVVVLDHRMNLV